MGRKWPTVGEAENARRGFLKGTGAGCWKDVPRGAGGTAEAKARRGKEAAHGEAALSFSLQLERG